MTEPQPTASSAASLAPDRTPTVSIGMPVYNGAKYIREALDSLLAQTFTDFDLVISDNASTDATQAICEEYARRDSRVRYVRQRENKGAIANFKFVLDYAQADLFMWAAYDDLWATDYLMDAITLLSDKSIDFVFPSFELRSIHLGIARRVDRELFRFIESPDRRQRALAFLALHYLSHKANIVYSMFRLAFIKTAWATQDIGNDVALGAVILNNGRGARSNALFSKRYDTVWPGMLPPIIVMINDLLHGRRRINSTRKMLREHSRCLISLLPEYGGEIKLIYDHYQPYMHGPLYRVCSIR